MEEKQIVTKVLVRQFEQYSDRLSLKPRLVMPEVGDIFEFEDGDFELVKICSVLVNTKEEQFELFCHMVKVS